MAGLQAVVATIDVEPIPATSIGPFYSGPDDKYIRLLLRNVGGVNLFLAFDSSALNGLQITSQHFELPAGFDVVLVLSPRQTVYAVGVGGGGRLTYAASEALPVSGV